MNEDDPHRDREVEFEAEPELLGYEPHDRPVGARRRTAMRFIVLIGVAALVLPGILVTVLTADRTAQYSCAAYTAYYAPEAVDSQARFDLFGPSVGWNCYARFFGGDEIVIASLGLIPGGRPLPTQPLQES